MYIYSSIDDVNVFKYINENEYGITCYQYSSTETINTLISKKFHAEGGLKLKAKLIAVNGYSALSNGIVNGWSIEFKRVREGQEV